MVTASRSDAPLLTAPAAVSVRTGEELASEAPRTFVDLFQGVPGIQIQGNARRITEAPNIRGFADQQVVVRQDGGGRTSTRRTPADSSWIRTWSSGWRSCGEPTRRSSAAARSAASCR